MASNTSDSSSSGSSNGGDVYRNAVEQAVRSTIGTASFYGSPSKNLRERKQEVPPPPQQSTSDESIIDDTDDDKTYHPLGEAEADRDSDTPRVGSRRGSLRGLRGLRGNRGAPRTLFNRAIKRAADGRSMSPDMFAASTTSSTDSEAGTIQPDV